MTTIYMNVMLLLPPYATVASLSPENDRMVVGGRTFSTRIFSLSSRNMFCFLRNRRGKPLPTPRHRPHRDTYGMLSSSRGEVHGEAAASGAGAAGGPDAAGAEAALGHRRPGRPTVPRAHHPVLPAGRVHGWVAGTPPDFPSDRGRRRQGAHALLPLGWAAQGARGPQARRRLHRGGRAVRRGRRRAPAIPLRRGAPLRRPWLLRPARLSSPPLPGTQSPVLATDRTCTPSDDTATTMALARTCR